MYNGRPTTAQPDAKSSSIPASGSSDWSRPRKGSYCEYKQEKLNKAIIDAYPVATTTNKTINGARTNIQTHTQAKATVNGESSFGTGFEARRNSVSFFGSDRDGKGLPIRDVTELTRNYVTRELKSRDTDTHELGYRDPCPKQIGSSFGLPIARYGSIDLGSCPRQNNRHSEIDYISKQPPQNYQSASYQNAQKSRYDTVQRQDHYKQSNFFFQQKTDLASPSVPVGTIVPAVLRKKIQIGQGCELRTGSGYAQRHVDQQQSWTLRERNGGHEAYVDRYQMRGQQESRGQRRKSTIQNAVQRSHQQYAMNRPRQIRSPIVQSKAASRSFVRSNNENICQIDSRLDNTYFLSRRQTENTGFTFANPADRERDRERDQEKIKYAEENQFEDYRSNLYKEDNKQSGYGRSEMKGAHDQFHKEPFSRLQYQKSQQRSQKTPIREKHYSQLTDQANLSQSRKNLLIQKSKNLQQKVNELSASKNLVTSASKDQKEFRFNNVDGDRQIQTYQERIERIKNNKDRVYQSPFKDRIKPNPQLKVRQIQTFHRNNEQPLKKSDLNVNKPYPPDRCQELHKKSPVPIEKQMERNQNSYHQHQHQSRQATNSYQTLNMKKSVGVGEKSSSIGDDGSNGCMNRINALNEKINEKISMLINAYEK